MMKADTPRLFLLSVEDDQLFQNELCSQLGSAFNIDPVDSLEKARTALQKHKFDVVLLDRFLPDGDSIPFIDEIRNQFPGTCVLLLTSNRDFSSAKRALELGASNYLVKPPTLIPDKGQVRHEFIDHLICQISQSKKYLSTFQQNEILRDRLEQNQKHVELIGRSGTIQALKMQIRKYKGIQAPVLITGETGTGKELVADLLHAQEGQNRPFYSLNCAAIPLDLIESHLFGHVKGAFTGATQDLKGFFERANGGDLFLDEIGDIPYHTQVKLLRALESGEFNPVGSTETRRSQIRLISATNRNLQQMIYNNEFRADLFYRINALPIRTESLRSRTEDILDLAPYFLLKRAGIKYSITQEALKFLQTLPWPGNVRELKFAIELAFVNARSRNRTDLIIEDFEISSSDTNTSRSQPVISLPQSLQGLSPDSFSEFMDSMEKHYIANALELCSYDITLTHLKLGISRTTLYQKLKEHKISAHPQNLNQVETLLSSSLLTGRTNSNKARKAR